MITDRLEVAGYQRARCHRLSADISSLADIDLIVERADSELVPQLLAHLEAARAALEAIHSV